MTHSGYLITEAGERRAFVEFTPTPADGADIAGAARAAAVAQGLLTAEQVRSLLFKPAAREPRTPPGWR